MGRLHINEVLGAKIKRLRQEAGITQATLSQRSGLFRTHLSRIECGTANPTLTAIVAIAVALEVDPAMLLKESALSMPGGQ
ncbi:XRE family transcriptional regulator [Rhodoferax lacus]|uniref:XRE family transcriptional regulator n=1 Tax=Rhodoferax lacus TaxID=2184758 RepID=A0A3E1R7J2_9BURK|nr:helix-turn-helix transcriptional regulator [Rhodoferax lacus]RFO95326.1 XRE family transcriptional regulator [Rhodoferax lacus]